MDAAAARSSDQLTPDPWDLTRPPSSLQDPAAQRLGTELRSQDDPMLDQIPTEVTNHSNARTDGVSSSGMLGGR